MDGLPWDEKARVEIKHELTQHRKLCVNTQWPIYPCVQSNATQYNSPEVKTTHIIWAQQLYTSESGLLEFDQVIGEKHQIQVVATGNI